MKIDENNGNHIIADEGKIFARKADGKRYGNELFLGTTLYIGGEELPEPHTEVAEDFEEVEENGETIRQGN